MSAQADLSEIVAVFRAEARELAQGIGEALLDFERVADPAERRQSAVRAFRNAHSIKGSAATLGMGRLENVVHALEDVLAGLRDGAFGVSPALVDAIFGVLDVVDDLAANTAPGDTAAGERDLKAVETLRTAVPGGVPPDAPAERIAPRAGAATVDEGVREQSGGSGYARVPQKRIEGLIAMLGEMLETKIRIEAVSRDAKEIVSMGKLLRDVQHEIKEMAMVPLQTIFHVLERAARDVSRRRGLDVRLDLEGGHHALDHAVVEDLKAPLIHLIRNAVDHGLDGAEARAEAGKPARGRVVVRATHRGNSLSVEVADDGRGIDFDAVKKRAAELGLDPPGGKEASDDWLKELLFMPGFSTAASIDSVSGRGVGLDVVRDSVTRLRGTVQVQSERGKGTTFGIVLPLTLATDTGLFVESGAGRFVIPRDAVERVTGVGPSESAAAGPGASFWYDGRHIPAARLDACPGLLRPVRGSERDGRFAVVIAAGSSKLALLVDRVDGEAETVVRDLGRFVGKVPSISGVTVTAAGEMCFVLDPSDLLRAALRPGFSGTAADEAPRRAGRAPGPATVLVVDDSVTSRMLNQKMLSASGFKVITAAGGGQALEVLRRERVNAVLTDVSMPVMDGYELTRSIRRDPALKTIPVVLLTSLDRDEDRARGVESGADAYLVKGTLSQADLVSTINRMV